MFEPCVGFILTGVETDAQYRLVKPIGQGNNAVVWLAAGPREEKRAIKFPNEDSLRRWEDVERFQREISAQMKVGSSPFCVSCSDYGFVENDPWPVPFLVMEYCEGESLRTCLDDGRLSARQRFIIARQMLLALQELRSHGIVHRDIKPDNVLIVDDRLGFRAKLADFGLARTALSRRFTMLGSISGTPLYMSPEQARGEAMDHRSDLYAAMLVLREMMTGVPPTHEVQVGEVVRAAAEGRLAPVEVENPYLAVMFEGTLVSNPDERPDINWILQQLEAARRYNANNTAPSAPPPAPRAEPAARRPSQGGDVITLLSRPSPPPIHRASPIPRAAQVQTVAAVKFDLAAPPQAVPSSGRRLRAQRIDPALLKLQAGFPALDQDPFQTDPGSRPASLPSAPQQPSPTLGQWLASAPIAFWLVLASFGIPILVVGVVVIIRALLRLF